MLINDLVSPGRCTRLHHFLAFETTLVWTDIYKTSAVYPQTIRNWKSLADSPNSAECAEDSATMITFLVRRRDKLL